MQLPEPAPWSGSGWRAVEAQHIAATMALVNHRVEDQLVLEKMLEDAAKPNLPAAAQGLHYLLASPFRYSSPPPAGSRFRGRFDPAVFYGAEDVPTACAEAGYWRWRFWMDSQGLAGISKTIAMTLFEFYARTQALLDLTIAPLSADRDLWTDRNRYSATQELARLARAGGIEIIRSESARNGPHGRCLNIMSPQAFRNASEPYRHVTQTWQMHITPPAGVIWQRELVRETLEFSFS